MQKSSVDLVIAYARADRGALADCSAALVQRGYVVWWDSDMTAGRKWREQFDEQVERARKVIVIWSKAASNSKEVAREMAFAYGQRKLVPLCIDDTPPDHRYNELDHKRIVDFGTEIDAIVDAIEFVPPRSSLAIAPDFEIELGDLPRPPARLFGREVELAAMQSAWRSSGAEKRNVFVVHALGGAGKSALVGRFIDELRSRSYDGASRVYAWSAYSQGANKRADAGKLFTEALAFFGYAGPPLTDQVAQARTLSNILQKTRSLLVLDGLEPLQGAPKESGGRLKDKALATLIKRLADHNPGLLVLTSRQPLPELKDHGSVVNWALEHLSTPAGVALLQQLGVRGREKHLKAAVEEVEGHALSVTLLGTYIATVEGGDIRRRDRFQLGKIIDTTDEFEAEDQTDRLAKRTNKIMRGYVEQLQKLEGVSAGGGQPELSLLSIVGLFDRPVEGAALATLIAEPHVPGLNDGFLLNRENVRNFLGMIKEVHERPLTVEERSQRFRFAKERLRALRILAPASPLDPMQIDAHPVVRQYFGDELRVKNPAAFTTGHARLFEHYRSSEPEEPESIEAMEPLFHAIKHGCLSGNIQPAFALYWYRISRGEEDFAVRSLGAVSPMISLLATFFDEPWRTPSPELQSGSRRVLINRTANLLTGAGRLHEALEVLDGARLSEGYYRNAHYSSLLLDLGEIGKAIEAAEENLQHASGQTEIRPQINAFVQLAFAFLQHGDADRASTSFRQAELLQREHIHQKRRQFLFSTNGFRFNQLLLDERKYEDAAERAQNSLVVAKKDGNPLAIGLDTLVLAQCAGCADTDKSAELFDDAVAALRVANRDDYLPYGLQWRARFLSANGQFEKADDDLRELEEIAQFGEMRLFLADAALLRAQMAAARGDMAKARTAAGEARTLIERSGYGRRRGELDQIERDL